MLKNSQYKSVLISSKHVQYEFKLIYTFACSNKIKCTGLYIIIFFAIDSQIKSAVNKNNIRP